MCVCCCVFITYKSGVGALIIQVEYTTGHDKWYRDDVTWTISPIHSPVEWLCIRKATHRAVAEHFYFNYFLAQKKNATIAICCTLKGCNWLLVCPISPLITTPFIARWSRGQPRISQGIYSLAGARSYFFQLGDHSILLVYLLLLVFSTAASSTNELLVKEEEEVVLHPG